MGLRRILKKKTRFVIRKPVRPPAAAEKQAPKNGWLTVAVGGAILATVLLGVANWRLMQNPSVASRAFWSSAAGQGKSDLKTGEWPSFQACDRQAGHVRPEVTFYSKLMAPDEHLQIPGPSQAVKESAIDAEQQNAKPVSPAKPPEKRGEGEARAYPHWQINGKGPVSQPMVPPRAQIGSRAYTVQVGAFSHPRIAQQWATRWKERGYNPTLKPVARPNGIIYRLYLGSFSTESEADELVARLKSKEGISALRLVVRN